MCLERLDEVGLLSAFREIVVIELLSTSGAYADTLIGGNVGELKFTSTARATGVTKGRFLCRTA